MTEIDIKNSKICPMAWKALAYFPNGTFSLCCRSRVDLGKDLKKAISSDERKKIQEQMLSGEEPSACEQCYVQERQGVQSLRELSIIKYKRHGIDLDITSEPTKIQSYDLRLTNVCNFKCRMCFPFSSSLIEKEYEKMKENGISLNLFEELGKPFWPPAFEDPTAVIQQILAGAQDMKHLYISGGEPFYDPQTMSLLTDLVKSGHSKHIFLDIHSNGSFFNEEIIKLLESFKTVNLMLSIDGTGKVLEYQRTGAKWPLIKENVNRFAKLELKNLFVCLLPTITLLNVFNIPEFLEWYKEVQATHRCGAFYIEPNFLDSPLYLNTDLLSQSVRAALVKEITACGVGSTDKHLLSTIEKIKPMAHFKAPENRKILLKKLVRVTSAYDQWRKQNLLEYIPVAYEALQKELEELSLSFINP